ncbi:MAG: hypothetical protein AAGJ46_13390 [Planctomycetota bacterium]
MSSAWKVSAAAALAGLFAISHRATADTAVINFTTDLLAPSAYTGPAEFDPFNPSSITDALINGEGGFLGDASPDWTRLAGQIVIDNYTGPGTYSTSADGSSGVGVYVHGALLNRIETRTTRTFGPITAASTALGAAPADGDPPARNDDIYLPTYTPLGVASVTITEPTTGNFVVDVDYDLDFTTLPEENARFLRVVPVSPMDPTGFRATALSTNLDAFGAKFRNISVSDTAAATVTSGEIGVSDDLIPYGGFNPFDAVAAGNLSNTIVDLTRGVVRNELAASNIRVGTSDPTAMPPSVSPPISDDPLAGQSGTAFFFDLTAGNLASSVVIVPEPSAAAVIAAGFSAVAARRRRLTV